MSSEPVKIEVDCAVTPYSHHHHHHHHSHHHIHHATHLVEPEEEDEDEFVDEEDDDDDEQYVITDIKNDRTNPTLSSAVAISQNHLDESSSEEDRSSNDSGSGSSNSDTIKDHHQQQQFTCATTVSELIVQVTFDSPTHETAKSFNKFPSGISSPIRSSEHLSENYVAGNKLMADSKDGLQNTKDAEDDLSENDCEDIVDPVGHQNLTDISLNPNNIDYHQQTVTKLGAEPLALLDESTSDCDDDDDDDEGEEDEDDDDGDEGDEDSEGEEDYDNDDEDEDDEEEIEEDEDDDDDDGADDVSFDGNCDENISANTASSCSPDLLDGERMLEVTRKLVRSTERDPDRDLRKQVLLKTAIRKLPHFMEYNHYSDSFEQNLQLHGNNNSVNCLSSTTQYYEHHISLNHHIDATQPKSYYHSVQPNAIQMSTTSLRMLDLNDDQEAEATIEVENHQISYNHNSDNNCQTSLEHHHQHHDYRMHQHPIQTGPYERYIPINSHLHGAHHLNDSPDDNQHDRMIHDLSTYSSDCGTTIQTSSIERHATLDNLYQPMSGSDIVQDSEQKERSSDAFQVAHGTCDFICKTDAGSGNSNKILDNLDASRTNQDVTNDEVTTNKVSNNLNQDHNAYHLRDHSTTATHAYLDVSNETEMKELVTNSTIDLNNSPGNDESNETTTTSTIGEQLSASGSDISPTSSSMTSTPDEGVNSIISQSTDATNGHNDCNTSLSHETSLNSSGDFYTSPYHQISYDSGVALFSPRSNKRSSSSIGLDDEMEVDHLTDLSTSSQQNAGSGQLNQFKKLRKKEIMD